MATYPNDYYQCDQRIMVMDNTNAYGRPMVSISFFKDAAPVSSDPNETRPSAHLFSTNTPDEVLAAFQFQGYHICNHYPEDSMWFLGKKGS